MWSHEAYADKHQLAGPHGELLSRIADFLSRKTEGIPERLEALSRAIDKTVRSIDLREALRGLVAQFRHVRGADEALELLSRQEAEWRQLAERIRAHGCEETIECYGAYFFSLDGFSVFSDLGSGR
jgi:hypothetical protein